MVIQKRDGTLVAFDKNKIAIAIAKAFKGNSIDLSQSEAMRLAELAALKGMENSKSKFLTVEEIQDAVVATLGEQGYSDVAESYKQFRAERNKARRINGTLLDYKQVMEQYLEESDWRVKENSTVSYSVGGLILQNSGAITANYWLSEVYDEEIQTAHRRADLHIHDLTMLTGYCAGWSLMQLIKVGIQSVANKTASAPAKHLSTLCSQMVNFLGIMQNEWAGAQAFSSFDTYLAPFVKVDNLSFREVKQCIQSFVHGVNIPSRWGTQAPFTNITLDWVVPEDLANLPCVVGGENQDFTYGECQAEMDMINKAFIEVMLEGDANGRGFQYPIPTYSITKDFDWSETENNRLLFEMTAKYGTPYFSNYINSDMKPSDVRSMCCRLRLDLRELRKKSGGYFGSGESTGSVGVVTINLPRVGYLSADKQDFLDRLGKLMDVAARSLHLKRLKITELLERGLYPYTKAYLGSFDNHFSTIGLIGMHEAILNAKWFQGREEGISSEQGHDFAVEVLNCMRGKIAEYQEQYKGELFNLEATPAESTCYRLAIHDKKHYPEIVASGTEKDPYYTNSTHLPVDFTDDVFEALDFEDELQTLYTSGTVFHAFLGEKLPTWQSTAALVKAIASNYKLPYFTISPTYSVCGEHGYLAGEQKVCPVCGKPAEVFSRITGYYRPVSQWNKGKAEEFRNRLTYEEPAPFEETPEKKPVLLVTRTCPKCKMAETELDKVGVEYEIALAEDRMDLVEEYGIRQAPVLITEGGLWVGLEGVLDYCKA